jgi:hypothetical protein
MDIHRQKIRLFLWWWFPTAAGQVRAQSCGICCGQSGTGADFLRVSSPCQFSFHRLLHTHHIGAGTSGLSLTPPQETKTTCLEELRAERTPVSHCWSPSQDFNPERAEQETEVQRILLRHLVYFTASYGVWKLTQHRLAYYGGVGKQCTASVCLWQYRNLSCIQGALGSIYNRFPNRLVCCDRLYLAYPFRSCTIRSDRQKKTLFVLVFLWCGETESTWYVGHCTSPMIDDDECGAVCGIRSGRGNRSTQRKPCPSAILSTTNPNVT